MEHFKNINRLPDLEWSPPWQIILSHLEVYMTCIYICMCVWVFFWLSILSSYLAFYCDILFWNSIRHLFWHPICHPFWHLFAHFLWHSGIFSDIPFGIFFGIHPGIHSGIRSVTFYSGILSGIYFDILSDMGTAGPALPTEIAVEVRPCPLRSAARGWGPAVPTEIWSLWLKSGSAHWDLELAVEVQQCPMRRRRRKKKKKKEGRRRQV